MTINVNIFHFYYSLVDQTLKGREWLELTEIYFIINLFDEKRRRLVYYVIAKEVICQKIFLNQDYYYKMAVNKKISTLKSLLGYYDSQWYP